ncbi:F-actin capping protein, beta subunit, conserved site-containing protein [Artemisia annua]|uniref:F-actin-capping protein subunit beta n=1 Tax=Artemisia annua TaxID=35608 RepID=A0A2U1QD49_ARTAN|nr:F-actin capping protein, beta subunit, conserved site-containing protein [Artemisia annua]
MIKLQTLFLLSITYLPSIICQIPNNCNQSCPGSKLTQVPYPFGTVSIGEFPVWQFSSDGLLVNLTTKCGRIADALSVIYSDNYAPISTNRGVSLVYLWEDDDQEGFSACFLIKKDGSKYAHGRRGYLNEGGWDAIHVIEVGLEQEGIANYCLTSTVMLSMTTDHETSGAFSLSGSIRRQMKADLSVADGHLCNMGKMIEELEGKLRYSLDQVYFGKTKEMIWKLRPPTELPSTRLP